MAKLASIPLVVAAIVSAGVAAGQVTTATFYGLVRDGSGAAVAHALSTITNQATGIKKEQLTDSNGEFSFMFVPIGIYTLQIEHNGFKTYVARELEFVSGQEVRQAFTLEVGAVKQQVTVEAQAQMVNVVSSEQSENLSTRDVRELPLANRNLVQLGALTTGSVTVLGNNNAAGTFNMNGLGSSSSSISLDGTEASSAPGTPQLMMSGGFNYISLVSLEAVQEVQVTKGIVPAEYAPTMSGNFNVVTQSGANLWHGSLFENWQGRALNAKPGNLLVKPPFTFNQFGGSLAGPIWKNKLLIFGVYEGYRRSAFQVVQGTVPTQLLRDQMLAAVPDYKLYLQTFPLPNQPLAAGALTGSFIGAGSTRASDNHFVIKPDYWITDHNKISATFIRSRPSQNSPRVSPLNSRDYSGQSDRVSATYTTFGSRWSAETRFGYDHNYVNRLDEYFNLMDPGKPEKIPGGRRMADITVSGFSLGGGEANISDPPGTWSLEQKIALQRGRHAIKFGAQFYDRNRGGSDLQAPGLTYANVPDLLANIPSSITVTFGQSAYVAKSKMFGLFVQDDWRLNPKLVLNLGLRYDFMGHLYAQGPDGGNPHLYNPDGLLDSSFHIGPYRPVGEPYFSDKLNLGPRGGFAYNPDGHGTNVIRFGAGMLFSPIILDDVGDNVLASPTQPFRATFTRAQALQYNLKFPLYTEDALALVQGGLPGAAIPVINPHLQAPYSLDLYVGYQHSFGHSLMLESAFVGNHGVKFIIRRPYNDVDRVTGIRPNPTIGASNYFDNSDNTHYTSWQTSVRKRFSRHLSFDAHYTWAKVLSYGLGDIGNNPAPAQNFFNLRINRGPAQNSLNHVATGDLIYETPWFEHHPNGFLRYALSRWQVSSIPTIRSGAAINIIQPSSLVGVSRPDTTGVPPVLSNWRATQRYLNPAAFLAIPNSPASGAPIRPGNLGNGAIQAPGLWNVDLGLAKNFGITERIRLQFRFDMFNAFNHTNLTTIDTNLQSATFGRVIGGGSPRTMQANARLSF